MSASSEVTERELPFGSTDPRSPLVLPECCLVTYRGGEVVIRPGEPHRLRGRPDECLPGWPALLGETDLLQASGWTLFCASVFCNELPPPPKGPHHGEH
jgi:hypothetical protein